MISVAFDYVVGLYSVDMGEGRSHAEIESVVTGFALLACWWEAMIVILSLCRHVVELWSTRSMMMGR